MRFLLRTAINAVALWLAAWLLPGITIDPTATVDPDWKTAAVVATYVFVGLIFGVVNAILGSVLRFLALPLTCLTLGLFALIVNAALLMATSALANLFPVNFHVEAFFWDAILGSIIVSVVSAVLNKLFVRDREDQRH